MDCGSRGNSHFAYHAPENMRTGKHVLNDLEHAGSSKTGCGFDHAVQKMDPSQDQVAQLAEHWVGVEKWSSSWKDAVGDLAYGKMQNPC